MLTTFGSGDKTARATPSPSWSPFILTTTCALPESVSNAILPSGASSSSPPAKTPSPQNLPNANATTGSGGSSSHASSSCFFFFFPGDTFPNFLTHALATTGNPSRPNSHRSNLSSFPSSEMPLRPCWRPRRFKNSAASSSVGTARRARGREWGWCGLGGRYWMKVEGAPRVERRIRCGRTTLAMVWLMEVVGTPRMKMRDMVV